MSSCHTIYLHDFLLFRVFIDKNVTGCMVATVCGDCFGAGLFLLVMGMKQCMNTIKEPKMMLCRWTWWKLESFLLRHCLRRSSITKSFNSFLCGWIQQIKCFTESCSVIECLQKLSKLDLRINILSAHRRNQLAQDIEMNMREKLMEILEIILNLAENKMLIQASRRGEG